MFCIPAEHRIKKKGCRVKPAGVRVMDVESLICYASDHKASDIHIVCGVPPMIRCPGGLEPVEGAAPLTHEDCEKLARELSQGQMDVLMEVGELDGSISVGGHRIRINLFRQQDHTSAALRILSDKIPQLENLGLPRRVPDLTGLNHGIVLVTGETGSGKSTTLAAMIDRINHTRGCHILTLEDPVEYVYTPDRCVINQREIGRDTQSFSAGLRAALREDPDIILVGEMRDLDTIETALTAAETGHLVLGTLHAGSAADSVDRMVDVFPEARQKQIRMQLSMTLQAVLSQQLLPTAERKGRTVACELMMVNGAIRNLIREGKTPQIFNILATTAAEGSVTMDNSIIQLYKVGKIDEETAKKAAHDTEYVIRNLR